jgi:hypothetical protein
LVGLQPGGSEAFLPPGEVLVADNQPVPQSDQLGEFLIEWYSARASANVPEPKVEQTISEA